MPQCNSLFKYEFNHAVIIKANNNGQVPLWHFSLVDQNNIDKREGLDHLGWASPPGELNLLGDWTLLLESNNPNNADP
jgi:hypothetical protein